MLYRHISVMLEEVLEGLDPKKGGYFIDCTLGGAGYTVAIAGKVGEEGRVVSIDLDRRAIENARELIEKKKINNITLVNDSFRYVGEIAKENFGEKKASGIVFDLGLSSAQLDDAARGFSFKIDAPLDMSFGEKIQGETTEKIVNYRRENELAKIFREYGEERFAGKIAREIVQHRKSNEIKTTGQLVEIIRKAIPKKFQFGNIHPATRTFQALRIATNEELQSLEEALKGCLDVLETGARIAVVSFHSLEDRIIKNFFKEESRDCVCPPEFPVCGCDHMARLKILTKKPILPSPEEIKMNPRARSAKLRIAEKL
ncbi:MAG: 16S rRNA (cytosine(1402)-N(4))-methyltransferase RsmH [Patescibacteria group bacterium]